MKDEEGLRKCAVDGNKDAVLRASVDNREIKNIDKYRIASGLFNVTYPSDPVFPTNSNFSQAVSQGNMRKNLVLVRLGVKPLERVPLWT